MRPPDFTLFLIYNTNASSDCNDVFQKQLDLWTILNMLSKNSLLNFLAADTKTKGRTMMRISRW